MKPNAERQTPDVIVVGTDLGPAGTEALREALRLARKLPAPELHVVHVVGLDGGRNARALARVSDELRRAQSALGRHVADIFRAQGSALNVTEVVLHERVGDAASAVHQVAIDQQADFIVVGTRKRNSVMRWLEGSVSQRLAQIAHCPVVIAHAKDYRGLRRSDSVLPPRPDQATNAGPDAGEVHMPARNSHIAGML